MGTWGKENFANETAMDWVNDFIENPTLTFLRETIAAVFEEDYLDSDVACRALSAIEVNAAARKNPCNDFPGEITATQLDEIAPVVDEGVITSCKRALERIIDENENELFELWRESGQLEAWLDVQRDLAARLN